MMQPICFFPVLQKLRLPKVHIQHTIEVAAAVVVSLRVCETSYMKYGPRREKTCLLRFANNKGADQPAHPRNLISAFVIRLLESIISRLATGEISIF